MRNFTAKEKIKLEKFYTNRPILEDHMSMLYEHKKVDAQRREIRKETSILKAESRKMRKNTNARLKRRLEWYHEYIKYLPRISSRTGKLHDFWKEEKDDLICMFAELVAIKHLFPKVKK